MGNQNLKIVHFDDAKISQYENHAIHPKKPCEWLLEQQLHSLSFSVRIISTTDKRWACPQPNRTSLLSAEISPSFHFLERYGLRHRQPSKELPKIDGRYMHEWPPAVVHVDSRNTSSIGRAASNGLGVPFGSRPFRFKMRDLR